MKAIATLAVVVVLAAGCGGSSKKSTATVVGTSTVANFLSPTFKAAASAEATEISKFVVDLRQNLEANAQTGSLLKTNCIGTVNTEVTQRAKSGQERQIARALVTACNDLSRALTLAKSGKAAQAKALAAKALAQARLAASASR